MHNLNDINQHPAQRYRQKAGEPAAIRIRPAQSFPIQCATHPERWWIFQIAPSLPAHEAYAAVRRNLPTAYPTNGALTMGASGYRNRTSGGLNNVGSNGNYWSFAPNSQTNARNLNFNSGNVNPLNNNNRANGFAVRPSEHWGKLRWGALTTAWNILTKTYTDLS